MKGVLLAGVICCLASPVFAQTTFMDLWCEYGGEGCEDRPPPTQKPAAQSPSPTPPERPVEARNQPRMDATPLIKRTARTIEQKGVSFGAYYALVIGNNDYRHMPKLKTAVSDAKEVARTLSHAYGFSTRTLINASRDDIIATLDSYRKTLGSNDNLLIYYAGHGWLDEESERGYWLPVDAQKSTRARWVSNADITDTLKALKARHVLVVADSCFSGTLTRNASPELTRGIALRETASSHLQTLLSRRSRTVLSSGALEPVSDQGGGQHSVFAYAFLKSLKNNPDLIDGTQLFAEVRRQVLLNATQTPQYNNIRFAGHDVGGDFIFVRHD